MVLRGVFLVLIVLCSYNKALSQSIYFVQFKIETVSSATDAQKIDAKISSKKGIVSSRTDHVTSTYFCSINNENIYSEDDFRNWFSKLGFEITCFNIGNYGNSTLISPHELKNCEENNKE